MYGVKPEKTEIAKSGWARRLIAAAAVVLCFSAVARAATYSICPSGCDYTSIQTAYNEASSGDTLELHSNIAENLAVSGGKSVNITSQAGQQFTWDGADNSSPTLQITSFGGTYPAWTISNVVMDHSSSSGGHVILLVRGGSGDINPNLTIDQCILTRTSTTNNNIITHQGDWNGSATTQVTITRTEIIGTQYCDGLAYNSGNNTHPYDLTNCILRNFTGTRRALYDDGNNVAINFNLMNCTFFNNNEAYRTSSSANTNSNAKIVNCLFLSNTSDIANLDSTRWGDITYSAISDPGGTGYGTGCQYDPTADEVISASTSSPNLRLSPDSEKCLDLGTNTGAPSDDFDGNSRPYNSTTDIGAFEFYPGIISEKSVNVIGAYINDTITFCITVTSTASAEDLEVDIWDTLPAHTVYIGCDNDCSYDSGTDLVTWFAALAPGYSKTVCFWARIVEYPFLYENKGIFAAVKRMDYLRELAVKHPEKTAEFRLVMAAKRE
ncbi:MAG: choice-of-anchor Q domain-containing protein [Candidatus Goldiibacteriota bacterium]